MRKLPAPFLRYLSSRIDGAGAVMIGGCLACCLVACGGSSSGQQNGDGGGLGGAAGSTAVNTAGTSGSGGRGAGGTTGMGGSPGSDAGADAGPAGGRLGLACTADAACGAGLICLKATDKLIAGAGGPANGYCTTACAPAAVDPCATIGGVCFDYQPVMGGAPQAYCMRTCTFGGSTVNERVAKCQNRPDVACVQGNGTTSFCLPTCSQDVDCPAPRKCDLQFNVCMDTVTPGDKVGAHCTVDMTANTTNCAGTCLQFGTATAVTASMCSSRCVVGELGGCNYVDQTMSAVGGTHGVCAYGSAANAFAGDLGFCTPECDGNNDCPDSVDHATCDLTLVTDIGHGACSFAAPTPDGGTDVRRD